jgi:chromate transport protein ChrA
VTLAFFVFGTLALLILLLALVTSVRNRFALPSLSGLFVGAGIATYAVLAQAASRCASENEIRPGLTASCTPPDNSTLIFLAAIAIVVGVALGLIAKSRLVPESERSRTARV